VIFVSAITTAHNTPSSAPLLTVIPIVSGTISRVMIFFPPGVNALAHLKLLYGLYQLFPSNEQASFAGGDMQINWDEQIVVDTAPLEIVALTWNDDDTYDHTITVHVVVQPRVVNPTPADVIAQIVSNTPATTGQG
jgi:hypothetical protein